MSTKPKPKKKTLPNAFKQLGYGVPPQVPSNPVSLLSNQELTLLFMALGIGAAVAHSRGEYALASAVLKLGNKLLKHGTKP